MSAITYLPTNDEEVFRQCTKDCGVVTATEDFQYFVLSCAFCNEKFLYFDAFIGHMQTMHLSNLQNREAAPFGLALYGDLDSSDGRNDADCDDSKNGKNRYGREQEDLTDSVLAEPPMIIKQEMMDEPTENELNLMIDEADRSTVCENFFNIKQEQILPTDCELLIDDDDNSYNEDMYDYGYTDNSQDNGIRVSLPNCSQYNGNNYQAYDEMVEESLLGQGTELTMHIKDRKMIQFLMDSYRRNPFLWDHRHPQFRDRTKRQRFLDWIVLEFKRRFNISLAKDAITRKWDNLRTVYKRECNRMALERTNISTLWYFKELHFLNKLYSYNHKIPDTVARETCYRRRFSAIWNDVSTCKLLNLVKRYPCFYNRYDPSYRLKEKRGEALQQIARELQELIDVSTVQISKRISQLRFDYSKQKLERLNCERQYKKFVANYTYYDQMLFMDTDIPPFKCKMCSEIVQTLREMDLHVLNHNGVTTVGGTTVGTPSIASVSTTSATINSNGNYQCSVCNLQFQTVEEAEYHQKMHLPNAPGVKYHCDLCTATFKESDTYEEHMRRHNDELLLPSLVPIGQNIMPDLKPSLKASSMGARMDSGDTAMEATLASDAKSKRIIPPLHLLDIDAGKPYECETCQRRFATQGHLKAHSIVHAPDDAGRRFKCDYPNCNKSFMSRQSMQDHMKTHYVEDDYKCSVCGKGFKSSKNLQNHKQIHDKIKRYICQICGSAFAQAAGLYLHKRRHNRNNQTARSSL